MDNLSGKFPYDDLNDILQIDISSFTNFDEIVFGAKIMNREDWLEAGRLHFFELLNDLFKNNDKQIDLLINKMSSLIQMTGCPQEALKQKLLNFIDDNFIIDEGEKFKADYFGKIADLFINIKSSIALFSFSTIFFPRVMKRGKNAKDSLDGQERLTNGIRWKTAPDSIKTVVDWFVALNPQKLNPLNLESTDPNSVSNSKCIKHLVSNIKQHLWIKNFIENYWPDKAKVHYKDKFRLNKKV